MGTDREGDIMQLTNTTDYAIRIVCYLASENKVITTAELSRELNIPASYIPKITKQLKEKEIVQIKVKINEKIFLMFHNLPFV